MMDRARAALVPGIGGQRIALQTRRIRFQWMSTIKAVHRDATITGAVLATGNGTIRAKGALLGYWPSPDALTSCVYLEARHPVSTIEIGRGTMINNGTSIVSEGPGVFLGERILVGPRVTIFDSDFHPLASESRDTDRPNMGAVHIDDDVFIGAGAIILQGVSIGSGAVIAAGAVVTSDVGARQVAGGSPARPLGTVDRT
jgi:maltose O-acetyltransferase